MKISSKQIGLISGPMAFFLTLWLVHPEDLSTEARAVLASTLWIAIWWITEAIPIAVTSLLPIVLFPLTGGLDIKSTAASFGHKYIFLYAGGFIIAIAIEKWDLHKRIALNIINAIGTDISYIILGFMVATAFLSMWISNTATSVMMLPIGMAIIVQFSKGRDIKYATSLPFGKALMLSIAYSASIGGIATLVGTPPNLVLAGVVSELYDVEITFSMWMTFGLPISLVLLVICWQYLVRFAFKLGDKKFPGGRQEIRQQLAALGRITFEEKLVLTVFGCTAVAWISRSFLLSKVIPAIDDTMIAICGAVVLFLLPSRTRKEGIITWEEAVRLPWGILLLFGGGLALAEGFKTSGLAVWIAGQMTLLEGITIVLVLLILIAAVNFLTEITSNLATTSMLLPILAPMAFSMNVHPYMLLVAATVAASCAFMLPVATPPNAVVFGSGYLRIPDMVRAGIWMNILSILLVTLVIFTLLPLFWGFDLNRYPEEFINATGQ